MKRPSKAIVLCAGYSTRMKPLTDTRPKCLLPLWGRPALSHTLETLHRWGVRDVLLNMHHAAQPLLRFALEHASGIPRLNISFEPDILGTGGAVRRADWFFEDSPVWLVNSDILLGTGPNSFFGPFSEKKCIASLWVTYTQGPRTVDICNGRVTSFRSRTPGAPSTATFCGLHLLDRRILPYIPGSGFSSIIEAYDR
ncbi:MAG: nucleotidyltransferase family protein, partial [Akkermansiaceae bacterium]|nr:nucleotidyltransferase family protein [Akkermansiaceae bacterium]